MLFLSNFGTGGGVEAGAAAARDDEVEGAEESCVGPLATADFAVSGSPFCKATEPNDLTTSADLTAGADAGKEEIGAEESSIEPKVTADPCFTAFRGMPTPSFMETP